MSAKPFKATLHVDKGVLERAKRLLAGAADRVHQHRASVGIHEIEGGDPKHSYEGTDDGDATLADVAMAHEFGAGDVPDRSWLRSWFDANESRLRSEMADAMRAEYSGDKDAVAKQSARWGEELRAWIETGAGNLLPLTLDTVEKKIDAGLSHPDMPLLATGQLVAAVKAMLDGSPVT